MRKLYEAANALEAHMILNLLEMEGLRGRVDGEYLEGGVGELQAHPLVRVMIEEADYERGREIIVRWEAEQPATVQEPKRLGKWVWLGLGAFAGAALMALSLRPPVTTDGIDFNRDGVLEEKWSFSGAALQKVERDRNRDGKMDYASDYDRRGMIDASEQDDDFNGTLETRARYEEGSIVSSERDIDGDSFFEYKEFFEHDVLARTEILHPNTGLPRKIVYYVKLRMDYVELDTNGDGTMDTRVRYDPDGEPVSREAIAPKTS
ncbi:hypothetical protein GCM10007907_35330 [Chitinimonas prasina]|uniref:DUF2007 domain-containing protein n=1 Tax=Chitinimonas prasina TaxID=1434937 RepID=A0ABQ5YJW9_9NEIS|nr:DUF2007 domain-containing protein [Chitinimonas prasina]GLR14743.1 hypothetical protein GCM10007907_35330 [Chitinimonas prasina]